jgi:uncharacterized protein (DUF885 family)
MPLVVKILLGIAGLLLAAVLAITTLFWWAPVNLDAYVNKFSIQLLLRSPEGLSQVGLVDGTLLDFHSGKLDDYTEAGEKKMDALYAEARRGLDRYGPAKLKGQEKITWKVVAALLDDHARMSAHRIPMDPYRVNQMSGVAVSEPQFLTDIQAVKDRRSAERYVSRVKAFGRVLREVYTRVEADRAAGITPPDFIIDKTLVSMRTFVEGGPETNVLVTTFAEKLAKAGGVDDKTRDKLLADAKAAVSTQVIPGYRAMIALFEDMRKGASHDAGVWRLPGGEAWYRDMLRSQTTTNLTPDEIHEIGLKEVARIEGEMNALLDAQGQPPGKLVDRIDRLMKDPAQLYPDTEQGKAEMLVYLNGLKAFVGAHGKDWFQTIPTAKLEIVRVPEYAQDSSAGGYYMAPAMDGSRPGRFYINQKSTADMPKWTLPTLFFHEGEPGHHFQLSAAQLVKGVPMIRQVITPNAYAEGWGLYAEKLAAEMGYYKDDPMAELGRLQSEMFRATRLVVDTGMHAKRWSRERAIAYMREKTGMTEDEVTREIERYVAWPGQACVYKIGELTILRLRDKAKAELGAKFDIREFHETVLLNGGLPLDVLEEVVGDWIAIKKV